MTIENQKELEDLKAALPSADFAVVRLEASPQTRAERIKRRELGVLLNHFLEKTDPLAEQMKCLGIGDVVVENDNRTSQDVAAEILTRIGWL